MKRAHDENISFSPASGGAMRSVRGSTNRAGAADRQGLPLRLDVLQTVSIVLDTETLSLSTA